MAHRVVLVSPITMARPGFHTGCAKYIIKSSDNLVDCKMVHRTKKQYRIKDIHMYFNSCAAAPFLLLSSSPTSDLVQGASSI